MVLFFVQSFVQSFVILLVTISNFFSSPPTSLSVSWPNLSEPFVQLFQSVNNGDLFVLEPSLMLDAIQKVNKQRRISTVETEEHLCWLSKRFHLPSFVQWNSNSSLTVGVFADQWKNVQDKIALFKETGRIIGQIPIYEDKSTNSSQSILHIFFANHNANSSRIFRLHIVFVYRSEHFLWIGATKDDQQAGNFSSLEPAALKSFSANHEQIFDPFSVQAVNGLYFADDIEHLLSQLPTSRYLHCPQQRNKQWMASNNHLKENDLLSSFYLESIVNMKRLMRQQQMEFFMISGTLLGWHRACHATPYTDDADFGSWGKYLIDEPPRENWLRGNISNAGFRLFKSFGHLEDSLEYTFQFKRLYLNSVWFKTDLFFTYLDGATSVIRMPLHSPEAGLVGYLNFTRFDLCSGVLFGYKLLTPCTPEKTITEEYGKDWSQPTTKWNYITASQNLDKWVRWNRSSPQVTYRSTFWEELFSVFNFF